MSGRVVQGWHPDPFGVHEARYFSAAGEPTKLVRDRGVESYDDPPSGADAVAAATARLSAVPAPPAAYAPRGAYSYGRVSERDSRRRPDIVGFAASGIILAAVAVAGVFVAQTIMSPKRAGTPGATGVAFVNQAATQTLRQDTADLVLSGSIATGAAGGTMRGTGAFDLGGKAGTLNMTVRSQVGVAAVREIWLSGRVYTAVSVDGRSVSSTGKEWIVQQAPSQGSATLNLSGGNPTAALVSLKNQGIAVSALGTRVIGGVACTGYTVTLPDAQATLTVWINPQNLVREISANTTFDVPSDGAPASAAPTDSATAPSADLTMDLSYTAAPLHVTAPPAASTVPQTG